MSFCNKLIFFCVAALVACIFCFEDHQIGSFLRAGKQMGEEKDNEQEVPAGRKVVAAVAGTAEKLLKKFEVPMGQKARAAAAVKFAQAKDAAETFCNDPTVQQKLKTAKEQASQMIGGENMEKLDKGVNFAQGKLNAAKIATLSTGAKVLGEDNAEWLKNASAKEMAGAAENRLRAARTVFGDKTNQ